jgi:hypothetical protein
MGITCCSKTGKRIIKEVGKKGASLILKVVALNGVRPDNVGDVQNFLEEIANEPYLYIGQNKMPRRMIFNGKHENFDRFMIIF